MDTLNPLDAVKELQRRGVSDSEIFSLTGWRRDKSGKWQAETVKQIDLKEFAISLNGAMVEQNRRLIDAAKDIAAESRKAGEALAAKLAEVAESAADIKSAAKAQAGDADSKILALTEVVAQMSSQVEKYQKAMAIAMSEMSVNVQVSSDESKLIDELRAISAQKTIKGVKFARDKNGFLTGAEFIF